MTVLEGMLERSADGEARVERITARARSMHFGRALLAVIAMLLAGIGWLVAGVWFVATWCAAAVVEGWAEARREQADRRGDAD